MQIRQFMHRYSLSLWIKLFHLIHGIILPNETFVLKSAAFGHFSALNMSTIGQIVVIVSVVRKTAEACEGVLNHVSHK